MKKALFALLLVALIPVQAAALNTTELLATIAMPLAVAAVADAIDVPADQLASVVATLNNAFVPAPQAVEIIRYVPVALAVDNGQPFLNFVQEQVNLGLTGNQFVTVVERQIQTYYVEAPPQITVLAEAPVVVDATFVPQIVRTRVAEVRKHPHGGPPGQLKKKLGVQTGATVVHKENRGRDKQRERAVVAAPMTSASPQQQPVVKVKEDHGKGHDKGKDHGDKGKENKGKGKGKG
jgi:hypothetical protein